MSTVSSRLREGSFLTDATASVTGADRNGTASLFRLLAFAGLAVLTVSYVSVLTEITTTVGGTRTMYLIVVAMFVGATVFARAIQPRTALAITIGVAALGFWYYLEATGHGLGAAIAHFDTFASDTVTLATGMSLYQMVEAGIWTLGFVPGPVFLSWYLVMRRRYVLGVIPGGAALLFLVLTTDATTGVTLVGVVGGIAAVGFGELDRRDGSIAQADVLAIMFAIIVVLSMTVTLVPGGAASPTVLVEDDPSTLDGAIDSDPDETHISGSVDLSPEVHFTVVSDEPTYWRTGVYDRYTGDSWVRTGPEAPYDEVGLEEPAGDAETVRQTVTIENRLNQMPVAAHPVSIDGEITDHVDVTDHGQPMPDGPLIEGDTYNVESAVLDADPEQLNDASTDYPEAVEEYYLQTPEDLSGDFDARTEQIIEEAGAETPYEKAAAIEAYFNSEYDYSLEVDRPDGNVADEFLLEMDEGYCVYFATTMTQMLRTEGVPARYVTGYTSGQQVDDHEHVVRGLDAHAWVEVYFPEHGWVAFEPTPPSDRDDVHGDALEDARADDEPDIDTDASEDVPVDGPEENVSSELDDQTEELLDEVDNDSAANDSTNESGDEPLPGPGDSGIEDGGEYPDVENETDADNETAGEDVDEATEGVSVPLSPGDLLVGIALLIGLTAGAHRSGVTALVGREARLYWHGFRDEPATDAERAYERLEVLLARRYRARRRGESPRQYLEALGRVGSVDARVRRVTDIHETARYGGGVSREEADEAVTLVSELAREDVPLVGRLWR